ncbi:MAG: PilN domain-containing protein [Acidobacteria bacterium]|nr:PilN domain-containing protein [Acidobacteriota bacterium]
MIRINLLSQEKDKPRRRAATSSGSESGQKIVVACTLVLAVAVLSVAWWYWSLRKDATQLTDEIAAAEQETARLGTLIVQVQQFEARKGELQQRVSLIEQLRRGQSGPVHLLDEVSRGLPEMLWLTQLEQKGSDVTIEGRCTSNMSLSDFVDNLAKSGWFKKPVEIVDSQLEQVQGSSSDVIRFTIKAQFAPPGGG